MMKSMIPNDINFARQLLLNDFIQHCLNRDKVDEVAVVGGTLHDFEVIALQSHSSPENISVLGVEEGQIPFDLNNLNHHKSKYDLVICTNVIEHIHNHVSFAKNLLNILHKNGVLWCAFPVSDMYHGSPEFYSSGFHPDYVIKLFERLGTQVQSSKVISSKRLYLFTHLLNDWPNGFRFKRPLWGQIRWGLGTLRNPRPPIRNLYPWKLLCCLLLALVSKEINSDPRYACVGWVKVIKN